MEFNYILDEFPDAVVVNNVEVKIDANFKTILRILRALEDEMLDKYERLVLSLVLFYGEYIDDENIQKKMFEAMMNFISLYKLDEEKSNKQKLFDFNEDSMYIYSAFYSQYSIDLNEIEYMHWFKFVALFGELKSDCVHSQIVNIRSKKITDKMTSAEKEELRKLKKRHALKASIKEREQQQMNTYYSLLKQEF